MPYGKAIKKSMLMQLKIALQSFFIISQTEGQLSQVCSIYQIKTPKTGQNPTFA